MNSITDDTLDSRNQLLLPEKSSATDMLDTPNESQEVQTDRGFHVSAILKGIPGFNHGGLND
jgi:hypothetical protein